MSLSIFSESEEKKEVCLRCKHMTELEAAMDKQKIITQLDRVFLKVNGVCNNCPKASTCGEFDVMMITLTAFMRLKGVVV